VFNCCLQQMQRWPSTAGHRKLPGRAPGSLPPVFVHAVVCEKIRHAVRYTAWGSRQIFLEDKIGTLEVGKRTGIAVWDGDLYSSSNQQIKGLKCVMTLFDGEIVHPWQDSSGTTEVR
jgi:Amidohydrolase family